MREEFMEREAGSCLEDDFAHLETRLLRLEKGWEEERSRSVWNLFWGQTPQNFLVDWRKARLTPMFLT